jgi:hypothetical protein
MEKLQIKGVKEGTNVEAISGQVFGVANKYT